MITIIPDIHGRVFWKKAVDSASKDDTIVLYGFRQYSVKWKNDVTCSAALFPTS